MINWNKIDLYFLMNYLNKLTMWGPYYGYVQLAIIKTKLEIINKPLSKSVSSIDTQKKDI
jgi:hypothetical protein